MIKNYLKIALRTLWKQKGITAINVLGLAAGMAVCLLVGLLFWDQLTHDDFHPGADRIYRVTTEMEGNSQLFATSSAGLASALREGVADAEYSARTIHLFDGKVVSENFIEQEYAAHPGA